MIEVVNEHGVTKIMNENLIIYCDKEDLDLVPNTSLGYQGALWSANNMHRKVAKRMNGVEPDVVNHISHLEYDNRRANLMDCDNSYNMRDIFGRSAYSVLNDCKWCQDLYLLYMTDAITADEFLYLRLLRLSCFPNIIQKCIGQADTQHKELNGVCLTYELFEEYGIKITVINTFEYSDSLFKTEPLNQGKPFAYKDNIFKFAKDLMRNRKSIRKSVNLRNEKQITSTDEVILGEFRQYLLSYGVSTEGFFNAVKDYLRVCNYRFRFLYLMRTYYAQYSTKVIDIVELIYTEELLQGQQSRLAQFDDGFLSRTLKILSQHQAINKMLDLLIQTRKDYMQDELLNNGLKYKDLDFSSFVSAITEMLQCVPDLVIVYPELQGIFDWYLNKEVQMNISKIAV